MLREFDIDYKHFAALGGLRSKARTVQPLTNAFWHNQSFHNFADYAMSEAFRDGLAALSQLGSKRHCAIMCAEALWWRCHRRIIADYLIAAGATVFHILSKGHIERAVLTAAARRGAGGSLVYPAAT
jgi:uncharacterized protein (DUF488 family)